MLRCALFLTSFAVFAYAQTASFEVASIRPSALENGRYPPQNIDVKPGALTMRNMRLAEFIRWAYDVHAYQISGPDWLGQQFFDISARAATPATEAELRQMAQAMLASRFQMTLHRETKTMPVFILTVGKNGHKLKPPAEGTTPGFRTGNLNLTGTNIGLADMVEFLSRQLRQPLIDQTQLTGKYDYYVDIAAFVTEEMRQNSRGGVPLEAPTIIGTALREQLGLQVEPSKAPIEMLVIDKMEKTPTEN